MSRTLAQLAKEALIVQDAVNLSGVAQSFASVMIELADHTNGTRERNEHPIAVLFIDKMADLANLRFTTSYDYSEAYSKAYQWAEEQARKDQDDQTSGDS